VDRAQQGADSEAVGLHEAAMLDVDVAVQDSAGFAINHGWATRNPDVQGWMPLQMAQLHHGLDHSSRSADDNIVENASDVVLILAVKPRKT
jgi:hypothetical protein